MGNQSRREADSILKKLEDNGFEAYYVGGFVRDTVMGRSAKDIDIATSALPEQVMELFNRCIPTGLRHGTVTVLMGTNGYEITTFRQESEYEQFRRPKEVIFITSLEEDLRRRDFTVNAMAMDRKGNVYDPFGGRDDLTAGRIRCVGDADLRFREDALRMLRGIRFASQFGFAVDEETWLALLGNLRLFRHVAMERVRAELEKMMEGPGAYTGWKLLADSRLLKHTKKKLSLPVADWTSSSLPKVLKVLPSLPAGEQRWMLLALSMEIHPQEAEAGWRALTFPAKTVKSIGLLLSFHRWWCEQMIDMRMKDLQEKDAEKELEERWKTGVVYFGDDTLECWLTIHTTILKTDMEALRDWKLIHSSGKEDWLRTTIENGTRWLEEMPVRRIDDLFLQGDDLIRRSGLSAGPWTGKVLKQLLLEAALGHVPNEKEALLDRGESLARRQQ